MSSSAKKPTDRVSWVWHGVYALVILAIGASLYFASKRIDYSWHWERLPEYVISTEGEEIRASFDGFVEISEDGKTLTMTEMKGSGRETFSGFSQVLVGQGDLVFQNDVLARKPGIRPGPLLIGLWLTLKISAISLVFALPLGLIAGLGRVARNPAARNLATTYVEIIRGTPLLVQIFIFYFFIGTVLQLSAFTAGVAALSVFTGAYVAEIVRAGIEGVARGQMEAARSLGMSYPQSMRYVILPQALRKTLPPLTGQFINLIKDSSLVSVMALTDLTKAGREVVSSTFSPFEVWFSVAILYLLLTGSLSLLVRRLEKRLAHD
ncbi:amino acid ABC transporter permease [Stenotrophobium rhamnosiphilum]|uniref:Putative glutamine transport system permease protein GlnP n=1 Tax=Stenotrophobium rhamnosiphilum TaxID=2029166 RepID=A0A2T5MDX9_9GAMM|nr:amino acid ABC transporter permease [Stenotrophobium rhamnosiphilum]PTU30798.1 ABC transporter permease [Stenotrophobium rhamnosiphilum]